MKKMAFMGRKYAARRFAASGLAVVMAAVPLSSAGYTTAAYAAEITAAAGTEAAVEPETVSETDVVLETETVPETEAVLETVTISGTEEFLEFARQCQQAVYSENRRFVLDADLDLSGMSFETIPVFSGIFEGNGHSIIGLDLKGPGSVCGLFRYIETGAIVRNLNVEGNVAPGGDQEKAGGVAGVNEGMIVNCIFRGTVTGEEQIGGIAGSNEEDGLIQGCASYGEISGHWKVGGITGNNEGTVEGCTNEGLVNADGDMLDAKADEDMSVDTEGLDSGLTADIVNDIGGIAGYSSGTLRKCVNKGPVGCEHIGNRVGGIVGRHNGLAEECQNEGTVAGNQNVAGIAGVFEPHLEKFYEEDTFDELDAQMDVLEEIRDALSDQMRGMGDRAGDHMDVLEVLTEELKDMIRDFSDDREVKRDAFDEKAGSQMDTMDELIDSMELDVKSDSAEDAFEEIKDEMAGMRRALTGLKDIETEEEDDEEDAFDALEESYQEAMGLVEELERSGRRVVNNAEIIWEDGIGDAVDSVQDFTDDLDALRVEAQDLMDMVEEYKDELSDDMKGFKNRMRDKTDAISDETDRLSDDLDADKDLSQSIKDQMDDQMDAISDTIDDGKDRLKEEADEREEDDHRIFEDVSAENTEELGNGLLLNCVNSGRVIGDYQAGGIAGKVGYERFLDAEQDPEAQEDRTFNLHRTARALIRGCRNTGEITVQNDYAGGIAGIAELGLILSNSNFTDIETQDGDYAGGIAGYSEGSLIGNYMKGTVTGNDYAGGIAGYGKTVEENCSMSVIKTSEPDDEEDFVLGEYHGSIVGDLDEDGVLSGNVYVDNGLGANNGLTHKQEAEGIAYEDFLQRPYIPSEFYRIRARFFIDDEPVGEIDCEYSQTVQEEDLPELPEREGFYARWETEKLENVLVDPIVHAVYLPYVTAIASSDEKKPFMMAEGAFYPDAEFSVWDEEPNGVVIPEGYRIERVVGYQILYGTGNAAAGEEAVRMRIHSGSHAKSMSVGVANGEQFQILPSERSGEYLVFEAEPEGTLILLEKKGVPGAVWAAVAVLLAAGGMTAGYLVYRRKKTTGKEDGYEDETEEDEESVSMV